MKLNKKLILSCVIFPTPLVLVLNGLMEDLEVVVVMEVIEAIEEGLKNAEIMVMVAIEEGLTIADTNILVSKFT